MERKRKIPQPDGSSIEATEIGFRSAGEHWNEYLLDDGTVARIKLVVTEILRIEGQYDPHGNPLYVMMSTNVTNVSAPEDMRRQP